MALLPASSALDLATDHLAQVEALYLAIRKANVEADATGTPQQQARENVRLLSNLYIAAKKARLHPHARTVHEKSHAARMILESDWRSAIMRLSNDLFYKLDVEAAYNAAVRGWLPAPDDPPDGVLAGETPGFFKMRRIRKDVAARLSTVEPGDLAKVEAWGGARGSMGWLALNAKDASHVRILRDANGDPVAVAAVGVEGGDLRVRILGAKEGFGRRMMQELSKEATKQGLGMSLVSTHGSEGFYQKLGMSGDASGLYRFSPEQTSAFSKLGGTLPPPGAKASGLSPMENMAVQQMAWTAVAGAKEGELITSDTIRNALATSMDESVWARGAVQQYLGIAMQTASAAGQVSLEHLGLDKTWTWANPENMANDLFGVRGSKVVQNMYGDHLTTLQNIITDATDPRNPKTIAEVKAAIGEQWPGLQRYQVERIARTETGAVWMQTAANSYEANGIGSFESIVAQGPSIGVDSEDPCDDCVEAAAEVHDMNDDLPPWHPNCRCDIVPILDNPDGTPWLPPDEPWTGGAPPEDFTPTPAPAPPLTAPEPFTAPEPITPPPAPATDSVSVEIGITPFRAGEDNALGFYDSKKYAQFLQDVHTSLGDYGVQLDGIDHVTGVWEGSTEPSLSLHIHDGIDGVRAYAANLGKAYNQDGVLLFQDVPAGDVMATFRIAVPQDDAIRAMAEHNLPGGRFTSDGRLQIIGSGADFAAQVERLAETLQSPYDIARGSFSLLERDAGDYTSALSAFHPHVDEMLPPSSEASLRSNISAANFRISQLQTKMGRLDGAELEQARARLAAEMKARDEYQAQLDALSNPPEVPPAPPAEAPPVPEAPPQVPPPPDDPSRRYWTVPDSTSEPFGITGNGLTNDELFAIDKYVGSGTLGSYQTVNQWLRKLLIKRGKNLEEIKSNIALLDSAIEKAPALDHPMTLYRGVGRTDFYGGVPTVGQVLEDPAFLSTSTTPALPTSWADVHGDIWTIEVPAGTKGINVNAALEGTVYGPRGMDYATAKEKEIILARGQKIVVDSVKERVTTYPNGGSVTAHDVTAHIEPAGASPAPPAPAPPAEPPVSPPPAPPAAPPLFPSVPVKPLAIAPGSWDEQAFNSTLLPWKGQEVRITGQSATGTGTYVTQGTLGYYEKWPVIDNATLGNGSTVLKIEVKVDGEWKTIAEGSPTVPSATVVAPVKPVLESPRPAPNIDHRPPPNPEEKPLPEKVAEPEQTTIEAAPEGLGTKEGADTALWRLYNDNPKVQFGDTQVRFTFADGRTMRGNLWRAKYGGEDMWVIGRKVVMRPDLITKIEFKPGSSYQVFEEAKTLTTGEKQMYRMYDEAPAPREYVPQFKSVAEAKKWLVDSRLVTMADLASLNDLKGLQAVCDGIGGVLRPYGVELDGVFMRNPGGRAMATYNRGTDRFIHARPGEEARKQMFSGSFIRGTAKSMKWRDATNGASEARLSFETSKERTLAQLEKRVDDVNRPQELRDKAQMQLDAMRGCTRWTIAEETPNPIRAVYAHEAAHALDASYGKISTTFGRILTDKWGGDTAQMLRDRYGVSEYGATGGRDAWTELWAESYAARELGVAIPKNISDAIDETLATIKTDGLTIRLGPNRVVSASEHPTTSELANATTYAREALGGASSVRTDALPLLEHTEPALDAAPAGTTIDVPRTTTSGPVWGTWVKESNGEWEQRSFGGVPLGSSRPSSFLDVGLSIAYTLAFPGPALGRGALADASAWATFATQLKGYLSPPQSERTRRLRRRAGLPADSAAAG